MKTTIERIERIKEIRSRVIKNFLYLTDEDSVNAALAYKENADREIDKLLEEQNNPKVWFSFAKFMAIGWGVAMLVMSFILFIYSLIY